MDNFKERTLGRTGLKVGRLGLAASYGAPAAAFEAAFEKGSNYFYVGSGRHRGEMGKAIKNICRKGQREKIVVSIHSYARTGLITEPVFRRRLKNIGIDQADVLILGWHNRRPSPKLMERVLSLKEKGLFRFLGMSGHNRRLFPKLAQTGDFDVFHIRYNAAHRGAETEAFPLLTGEDRPGIITYTATRWGHLLSPKKMPPGEPVPKSTDCYRFSMSSPAVDICLCGPKNMDQMQAALPALDLGPLSAEEMDRMKRIGDHIHQTGGGFFSWM